MSAFTRKFTNRGQGEKKIWQQAVSLVPNIEQLRSIARRFFGCQKWWRARHARKPFSPVRAPSQKSYAPFSSEFEAASRTFLTPTCSFERFTRDDAYFTNSNAYERRRISLERIGKSTIPRFNKYSLNLSFLLLELVPTSLLN